VRPGRVTGGVLGEEVDDEHGTADENASAKAQIASRETKCDKESATEVSCGSIFHEQQISEEMAGLRPTMKRKRSTKRAPRVTPRKPEELTKAHLAAFLTKKELFEAFRRKLGIRKPRGK
jgi:hypothetical protein